MGAHPGIEDSLVTFHDALADVDTILLGRATYEGLVRKWPNVVLRPSTWSRTARTPGSGRAARTGSVS
jgi:dihydrofolate reductase